MKKNFFMFSAILIIAMFGGVFTSCSSDDDNDSKYTFFAGEYDFEANGIYYTVSMDDLTCMVVNGKKEYKGEVILPSTVNYNGRTLTVVEIKSGAFRGCSQLTGITIPNTITSIGDSAFDGCYKLERINIEDGETVLNMGYGPWAPEDDGTKLGLFCLEWESSPWDNSPSLRLYIGRNLNCQRISYYHYGPFSFRKIKKVTFGNFVTTIEDRMFQDTKGLTNVTIPNSVTTIGNLAFYGCSALTNVTIPNSVTTIGNSAFNECSALTNITIPNSVTTIGNLAFYGCNALINVTIPNSVTSIGSSAFMYCNKLTSITIGNSVTEIGEYAFNEDDALTEVYSLNMAPPYILNSFTKRHYLNTKIFVPQEALEAYQNADEWKNFWNLQGIK